MNLFKISLANIFSKPLNAFLSLLLLSFGVILISILLVTQEKLSDQFHKNIDKIDLVLGAKGSPMQLILSSVYQVDAPTGNIDLKESKKIMKNLFVEQSIPLAYGDSYKQYRIVGTTKDYAELFEVELAEGRLWEKTFEVCIGGKVARESGLKIGDVFYSSHGLDGEGEAHENQEFTVVGIYESNQTVVDKVITTAIKSMWDIHDHGHDHEEGEDHEGHDHVETKEIPVKSLQSGSYLMSPDYEDMEITAALLVKNSDNIFNMVINLARNSDFQAVMPAVEINRLENNFGIGMNTLYYLGGFIAFLALLSVFVSLFNSLRERKYELALMRTMGGTRTSLFILILLEGIVLSLIGFVIGICLSRLGLWIISNKLDQNFQYELGGMGLLNSEWLLLAATLGVGFLAALLPAISAMRLDISKTLSNG